MNHFNPPGVDEQQIPVFTGRAARQVRDILLEFWLVQTPGMEDAPVKPRVLPFKF